MLLLGQMVVSDAYVQGAPPSALSTRGQGRGGTVGDWVTEAGGL